jgi:hypothetical protein
MELIIGRRRLAGADYVCHGRGSCRRDGDDPIYIGISGAYTGADSANSFATRNGALLAIQEANLPMPAPEKPSNSRD